MKLLLLPLLGLVGNAVAGTSGTNNCTVLTAIVDSGGGRSSSASYTNDGSIGGFGGVVTADSSREIARLGYTGQLYDTKALSITAATTNLNEGESLPLNALEFIDDGTVSAVNGEVIWTFTGPLASIDTCGLATGARVYEDTPALVLAVLEAHVAALSLMVRNTGGDDYGIYANDGIPDCWQVQYFGTNNPAGTGPKALFKYTAGLDPTNSASVFTLNLLVTNGTARIVFSPRWTNRTYSVQYCTELTPGNFRPLTGASQTDEGNVRTVTDLNATNTGRFYVVQIHYP